MKFWLTIFAFILFGTLVGGAVILAISSFAGNGLPVISYRTACAISFLGSYFSTINSKPKEDVDVLESALSFVMGGGIISVAVLLLHFGFKLFGA